MRILTSLILAVLVALAPSAMAAGCTCGPEAPQEERSCACCCEAAGCGCCGEQDTPAAGWDSCDCVQVQPSSGPETADEIVPEAIESALPVEAAPHRDRTAAVDPRPRAVLPPGFLQPLLV